jgi:hypothetical protein
MGGIAKGKRESCLGMFRDSKFPRLEDIGVKLFLLEANLTFVTETSRQDASSRSLNR